MTRALEAFWYCAALEKRLKSRPLSVTVLETPLVLFRDASGQIGALLDRCAHRGARLSAGTLRDGHVTCPYHGWRFDGQGTCVQIPALKPGEALPGGCQVPARPVRVQQGLVWVWMGDPAMDLPPLPVFPGHGDPTWSHVTFDALFKADVQ